MTDSQLISDGHFFALISAEGKVYMPKISSMMRSVLDREIKERVFREGCRILMEDGWGGFTMEKLANAVGVAKGTLYNYFKDKLDVVTFINGQLFAQMAQHVSPILERDGDCRDILRECIRDSISHMEGSRFLRMVMVEMHRKSVSADNGRCFMRDPDNKVHGVFMKFFKRGIGEGVFKPLSPGLLEIFMTSVFDGIDVHANFDPYFHPTDDATLESLIDMIIDGISVHKGCKKGAKKK